MRSNRDRGENTDELLGILVPQTALVFLLVCHSINGYKYTRSFVDINVVVARSCFGPTLMASLTAGLTAPSAWRLIGKHGGEFYTGLRTTLLASVGEKLRSFSS